MPDAILGVSAYYHDSAAALLVDGKLMAAAQEERFTRLKHDSSFPHNAARYVLDEGGIASSDLVCVAFYDKPFLKFERLLETYHSFAPSGLRSFFSAIPAWIKEKLFMRNMLQQEFERLEIGQPKVLYTEHHLSHAASAFFPSPFEEAAILTIDGVGEWATTTICHGQGNQIHILEQLDFPHSLGLLYSAFTYYCGFKVNSGEYKLMGLAPYGNPGSEQVARFRKLILNELVDIRDDGSFLLNMDYFNYAVGLTMCREEKWQQLFGIPVRTGDAELNQAYMDLALAIQQVTEEIIFKLADTAKLLTGSNHLTLAGGVALNCVANGKLLKHGPFDDLWIQPAAGDAGGAVGAACAAWHIHKNQPRTVEKGKDAMQGAYLGPAFSQIDVVRMMRAFGARANNYPDFDTLCVDVADLISKGKVVGWFQGRMEYGPRALGNRSIIGDPRDPEMQKRMNLKIKYREGFRPFAPSVMEECIKEYFDLDRPSPYMLLIAPIRKERRSKEPDGYTALPLYQRLYHQRSDLPSITHIDYSARIQSVKRETNERYWKLINAFKQKTGYGIIINTSFNVRGEPIVCTPTDAYKCFMMTEMDALVVNDNLFLKGEQRAWNDEDKKKYLKTFALD